MYLSIKRISYKEIYYGDNCILKRGVLGSTDNTLFLKDEFIAILQHIVVAKCNVSHSKVLKIYELFSKLINCSL